MNQTTIAGHLGADPEIRFTSSGQKITVLRVAARARRSANKDETIWWKVTIWGEQFDKMIPHFKKGSSIIVVGDLNKPEIFTDREGKPQISMSMTAFNLMFSPFGRPEGRSENASSEGAPSAGDIYAAMGETAQGGQARPSSISDDEIPF